MTSNQDFIFFIDRLATLLVENALEQLPYRRKTVITPEEVESRGTVLDTAVSINDRVKTIVGLNCQWFYSTCAGYRFYGRMSH